MPTFKVEVSHINLPLLLLLCCVLLQQRTHKLLWFHTVPPSLYPSPLCRGGEGVKREGREARHDDHHPSAPVHRRLHLSILRISGITELTPPAWRSCSWIKSFIPIKYLVKHISNWTNLIDDNSWSIRDNYMFYINTNCHELALNLSWIFYINYFCLPT